MIYYRTIYPVTTSSVLAIPRGCRFIQFNNIGPGDAILEFFNNGISTGTLIIVAGSSYDLPERTDGALWDAFRLNATATTVQISPDIKIN